MTIIQYPPALPGPQPGSFTPRSRRAASSIDGLLQQRARQRDAAGMASQYTYTYTPEQMASWLEWYRDTLLDGRRWFSHTLPGRGGMVQRVVRYREAAQRLLGAGIYRVEAKLEQRGASAYPESGIAPMFIGYAEAAADEPINFPAHDSTDILVLFYKRSGADPAAASGWATPTGGVWSNPGVDQRFRVQWRVSGGLASIVVPTNTAGACLVYRGASAIGAVASTYGSNQSTLSAPGLSASGGGSLMLRHFAANNSSISGTSGATLRYTQVALGGGPVAILDSDGLVTSAPAASATYAANTYPTAATIELLP